MSPTIRSTLPPTRSAGTASRRRSAATFSAIAGGEGGPDQGTQYINIYSDYNNQDHAVGRTINTSVFQEPRSLTNGGITAEDIGFCWTFSGEYKSPFQDGIADPETNATTAAYIITLDPNAGFAATNIERFETTTADNEEWNTFSVDVDTADPLLIGQILQFGFNTRATNFEDSGVFYDNLQLTKRQGACPPDPE